MLSDLVNFDSKSLIGVLVWGNVATGIIVYLYQKFNTHKPDYDSIRSMAVIRFLSAAGYLLMFLRGDIHDVLSVNLGNTFLFVCHYMEAHLMLELVNCAGKRIIRALTLILVAALVIFNLVEFLYKDSSLRVGMASVIIFSIFLLPTVCLLISKEASRFKRALSIFYIFLLCALIPRSVEAFMYKSVTILSNNRYQTLLFISLILLMMSNTIAYLLFMKERTDMVIVKLATADSLTNLLNRHSFHELGKQAFEEHKTSKSCLALLFFDLDHFKKVNDQCGHQFGDEVLICFAEILRNNTRSSDLCCRYGGEEFIILLMNVTESSSMSIAARIMRDIENHIFDSQPDYHITTSAGNVCGIPQAGETLEDYIRRGDEAMYEAKRTGRNKLVVYRETVDPIIAYSNISPPPISKQNQE